MRSVRITPSAVNQEQRPAVSQRGRNDPADATDKARRTLDQSEKHLDRQLSGVIPDVRIRQRLYRPFLSDRQIGNADDCEILTQVFNRFGHILRQRSATCRNPFRPLSDRADDDVRSADLRPDEIRPRHFEPVRLDAQTACQTFEHRSGRALLVVPYLNRHSGRRSLEAPAGTLFVFLLRPQSRLRRRWNYVRHIRVNLRPGCPEVHRPPLELLQYRPLVKVVA